MMDASQVTAAPGTSETMARTPNRVAAETPAAAPNPATANAQPAAPSLGPHPPTLSGMEAASSTTMASVSILSGGMSAPTAAVAMANVATWQATTTMDAPIACAATAGEPRPTRSSAASRRSTRRTLALASVPIPAATRSTPSPIPIAGRSTPPNAAPANAMTTTVTASCTTCPTARSTATARAAIPMLSALRPWSTARCTSPTTPPGSTELRNWER